MTTLFVSHGAPTLAIEPGKTGALLEELAASLPHPKAILVVSAHWDTPEVKVGAAFHKVCTRLATQQMVRLHSRQ
jgi:4,5-DOPA dioxygenase extradiol